MSCLLPQFKCSPDAFAVKIKLQGHFSFYPFKCKDAISIPTATVTASAAVLELEKLQLPLLEKLHDSVPSDRLWKTTTSTASTAVLDLEKLKLTSFDSHPFCNIPGEPWTYTGVLGRPSQSNLASSLAAETLLSNEEVVIADAASEALALAQEAVKVAKDAVMMISHHSKESNNSGMLHDVNTPIYKKNQLPDLLERADRVESKVTEMVLNERHSIAYLSGSEDTEPSGEELEYLETELYNNIAARSKRQNERKDRRKRAAEKIASSVVPVKPGSRSRKKQSSVPEIDYSDPLRHLRGTTNSSKLLTASEEQKLSQGIQDLLKLESIQKQLEERCGKEPTIAQWATAAGVDKKTLRNRINHGVMCKDKMIKSNIRLVISIAKNYQGAGMNLQDLVQEGCRGLLKGSEKFDASKGFKFSTYAHWWIKQAVRKSLSNQSRTIRLPFHMVDATYRVKEARRRLFSENGRHPDNEEVAEAAGLTMKRMQAVLLTPKAPRSLDQKIGINQDLKPSETIVAPDAETSEELLIKQLMKVDLTMVLDSLNPREKQVIKWRFGLEDGRTRTLQEIGELMGVSRERIRQIESCGFRKLKNKKRTKHLQQYVMP